METLHHRIAEMGGARDRFHGVTINNDYIYNIYSYMSMIHLSMINADECVNDAYCIYNAYIFMMRQIL